ncbi:MAG: hypothetical protein D6780_04150 [Candidatus Dadabacteria bacterium]|nr:MAG: hypothetical protein D6780_04150 [Candidatus Dadabacteria bacterium]
MDHARENRGVILPDPLTNEEACILSKVSFSYIYIAAREELELLTGSYNLRVDTKGRLAIKSIILIGEDEYFLLVWPPKKGMEESKEGRALLIFPKRYFYSLIADVKEMYGEKGNKLILSLLKTAFRSEVDGQGRILIARPLLKAVGIDREELPCSVIVSGCGNHLEVRKAD